MNPTQLIGAPQVPQVNLSFGDVVRVRVPWCRVYWHYGIVVQRDVYGQVWVIHCSQRRRGVSIESLSDFAQEGVVENCGFPSELCTWEVIRRAKSMMGNKWHLTDFNCEHFWRTAHGMEAASHQLQLTLIAGAFVVVGVLLRKYAK